MRLFGLFAAVAAMASLLSPLPSSSTVPSGACAGVFQRALASASPDLRARVDQDNSRYGQAAIETLKHGLTNTPQQSHVERACLQLELRNRLDVIGDTEQSDRYARDAIATYRAAPARAFWGDAAETIGHIHEAALEAALRSGDEREALRVLDVLEGQFGIYLDNGSEALRILAAGSSAPAARRGVEIANAAAAVLDPSGTNHAIERLYCELGMINAAHGVENVSREQVLQQLRECANDEQYRSWRVRAQAGVAYESLGAFEDAERWYQSAIEKAESEREAIPVAERMAFFGGAVHSAYEGLIRVNARRHGAQESDARSFAAVLDATQRWRARQFSDLSGREEPRFDVASLRSLQTRLAQGELIVGVTPLTDQLILWLVANDEFETATRPIGSAALEARVREIMVLVSDPHTSIEALETRLTAFSGDVLGPLQSKIGGARRLAFVFDGPLALVPPAVLSGSRERYEPLLGTAIVQSAPTADASVRTPPQTDWRAQLFGMADPTYPSLRGRSSGTLTQRGRARASARGDLELPALPETRQELEIVAASLGGVGETLVGEDASEARLRAADLRGVRFVHLATHGLLAGELADLSEPALVLSQAGAEDGLLRMSEAQSLRMDAELTVLSACNTGSGAVFDGEGVIGLSRAFLIAGSRAVLVSMWPVDSEATVDYMEEFYRLIGAGADVADANTNAARAMRQRFEHPFYWAPFTLISNSGRANGSRPAALATTRATSLLPDGRALPAGTRPPVLTPEASLADFSAFRDCSDACPDMIALPGGTFVMGSPADDRDADNGERPQRDVRVERFAASRFEITRSEYRAFARATRHLVYRAHQCFQNTEEGFREWLVENGVDQNWMPQACVSWLDAQAYVAWLSAHTGQTYRLLTEAEWEYAARAGESRRYRWGNELDRGLAFSARTDVRTGGANAFGLLGISSFGEWVEDCFVWGYANARADAAAIATPRTCDRVIRDDYDGRLARRHWLPPEIPTQFDPYDSAGFSKYRTIGFRVARVLNPH